MMDQHVLAILACPLCQKRLIYAPREQELLCRVDQLAFPIVEGVPVMQVSKARTMSGSE